MHWGSQQEQGALQQQFQTFPAGNEQGISYDSSNFPALSTQNGNQVKSNIGSVGAQLTNTDFPTLTSPGVKQNGSDSEPVLEDNASKDIRFGLLGLLEAIRMTDADLNTLALGNDLTTFGLNLNSSDSLYTNFS